MILAPHPPRPSRLGLLAGAVLILILGSTGKGEALTLAPEPVIEGPVVTLGDLFLDAGEAAPVPVGAAPAPGASLDLNAGLVSSLLARHDLAWQAPAGAVLRVRRAAIALDSEALRAALEAALVRHAGGRELDVAPLPSTLQLHFPVGADLAPAIDILAFEARTGRFTARLSAPESSAQTVSGTAREVMAVPVLARPIGKGEIIAAENIDFLRMPINAIAAHVLTDARSLVGQAARRPLGSSVPLRDIDIERPQVVTKGALVMLTFEAPGISLTETGRALASGAPGDVIAVVNQRSHRTVMGTILGPDRVRVDINAPRAYQTSALGTR